MCGCTAALQTDGDPLTYKVVQNNSLASAMMLGLADDSTAFIMDKVEGNPDATNSGKPTWSSLVNLTDFSVRGMDAVTNPFCAAGATLGNGSYIVVGGNKAVGYGGATPTGEDTGPNAPYNDQDGRRVVRILEPNTNPGKMTWIDSYNSANQMDSDRWYPGIEGLADGSVVIIGGATSGGYINRNYPNVDPAYSTTTANPPAGQWGQGGSNPSFEFWPPTGKPSPAVSKFMVNTSGLNMYPHTFLMPSGKIFMQANYSTILWDPIENIEEGLPDMPGQIIRVYPASAATAMLPLTPANNYTPTILFCGGATATDKQWGDFGGPNVNMYEHSANTECHSITPENADGSTASNVDYVAEGDLPEGRSMGQFIHLPDGTMVIVNGAEKGTAGYGNTTWNMVKDLNNNTVNLEGMAQNPTYRPVLYDPSQPSKQRLSWDGFGNASVARLYHSSAILIPDGSVLVAGSNPHNDVTTNVPVKTASKYQGFNTSYVLEQWYPRYYFEKRPPVQNIPKAIKYGGNTFNVTVPASFMGNGANDLANKTQIYVIRPGFSTHAYNFGQRSLELDHSYEVLDSGDVNYIVNPMPTNQNIFVPGPALFFVTVNGVPSIGKMVMIGGENQGLVPMTIKSGKTPSALPAAVNNPKFNAKVKSSVASSGQANKSHNSLSGGAIAGIVVGVVGAILIGLLALLLFLRHRRRSQGSSKYAALSHNRSAQGRTPNPAPTQNQGVGAMPWAHQTNDSFNQDPTFDESRMGMMHSNESRASMMDPLSSADPKGRDSFASLPVEQTRSNVNLAPVRDANSHYSDALAMTDMSHGVPDSRRTSNHGPVLHPSIPQNHHTYNTNGQPFGASHMTPSASHSSHLAGPREMPTPSNLQQHLTLSSNDAGGIRRVQ
ncbi:(methyl)glyoxal oxidase [Malassezia psittaci]|uniref:(Methyl)glyoxal oxidase n=1 Tax=Malassezia psittaci TaxID=1821823 RepID=A0AAF0F9Z0_9BASI|nr:(methyl)glyoxal oxidase [Malassezia psittaci]